MQGSPQNRTMIGKLGVITARTLKLAPCFGFSAPFGCLIEIHHNVLLFLSPSGLLCMEPVMLGPYRVGILPQALSHS